MGLAGAIRTCLVNFGDCSGRAPRSEFWWFALFQFIAMAVAISIDFVRIWPLVQTNPLIFEQLGFFWFVTNWAWIAFLLPVWAVSVRRLHDTNRSGWWLLLNVVPLGAIVLFVFYLLPGCRLRNTYGHPPGHTDTSAEAYAHLAAEPVSRESLQMDLRALRQSRMQST